MDRATLRCQDGLAQALTECWVRVYRLNNLISPEFIAHGNRVFRNQVRRIWADNVRAQDLVVLAQDDFGEALGMGTRNGIAIRRSRKRSTRT